MQPILNYIKSPRALAISLIKKTHWLFSESAYLRILYRLEMNKKLHLDNPLDYQEKLQWLKLYNHDPKYTEMVDKITAKDFAAAQAANIPFIYASWGFGDLPGIQPSARSFSALIAAVSSVMED